jgi:HEAT repeat protein
VLGKLGGEDALLALLKAPEALVRRRATTALGECGDARAMTPLLAAMKSCAEPRRGAVIDALANIADPWAVQGLIAIARKYRQTISNGVNVPLLQALGGLLRANNADASQELLAQIAAVARPEYLQSFSDGNRKLLGATDKQRAQTGRYLHQVADALNYSGHICTSPLLDALSHARPEVRAVVLMLLKNNGLDMTMTPDYAALLQFPNAMVRKLAADGLQRLSVIRALPALVSTLQDPDARIRASVIMALGNLVDRRAIAPLEAAWKDGNREMLYALLSLGDMHAVDFLLNALVNSKYKNVYFYTISYIC